MEAIIKKQAEVIDGLINDNKKLQSEIEKLKKELSDHKTKPAPPSAITEQVVKLKYAAPRRSMMERILSHEAMEDELVEASDTVRIKQLLKKGYSLSA